MSDRRNHEKAGATGIAALAQSDTEDILSILVDVATWERETMLERQREKSQR